MSYTYSEIKNQPVSWQLTIDETLLAWNRFGSSLQIKRNTQFIFTGCGTSFYLSQCASALFQEVTGYVSRAVPASEVFLSPHTILTPNDPIVVFAISRSGTTSEILLASEYLLEHYSNVQVIGVTCRSSQQLAKSVPTTISLDHADESSVVMTQSFTNMLLALQVFAVKIANQDNILDQLRLLPQILGDQFDDIEKFSMELGQDLEHDFYVFLGLGKYYGLANEANLKLKEMTQVLCEAYNPLEFRHGPISMLDSKSCVVLLKGNEASTHLASVAIDVSKYGVLVAELYPSTIENKDNTTAKQKIELNGSLSDWSRTVLYMPPLQLLAYYKALKLGLDPDHPRNLTQVVVIGE